MSFLEFIRAIRRQFLGFPSQMLEKIGKLGHLVLFLYFMQLQKFLYSVVLLFEARATKDYAKVTTVISG